MRMKNLIVLAACLFSFGSVSAGEPSLPDRLRVRNMETDILASLRNQDNSSESFGTGGVSGGTHLVLGAALAVGGLWLMATVGPDLEDNFANNLIAFVSPAVAIGGVAEMVYGVVKMIRTRNEIH
jgi:hypothetical protein